MTSINVDIVRLDPMRAASFYGYGTNPEEQAWNKLVEWAGPRGYLGNIAANPICGFNNPNPGAESPKYGYEFLIRVGPESEPEGDMRIVEFLGGAYAVTRCDTEGHPETTVPSRWKMLADWCRENHRRLDRRPALEKPVTVPGDVKNLVVDLCCPIVAD
jgi:DNA gyrase inhibitor GyrI